MKKRKYILLVFVLLLTIFICATTAYADMGPKDSLTIYVENPPNEKYYLDLLTTESGKYNNFYEEGERKSLNQEMLKLLYLYKYEGWMPALTEGTNAPMWGKLVGTPDDGKMVHKFGYMGLPYTYRIIIVTESGKVTVSDTYTRKALQSSIAYDYDTNKGMVPSVFITYFMQFATTCIPTLFIEILLLLLFGFKLKDNFKIIFFVNLATQIFLTATLGTALIRGGSLSAYFTQFPIEIIILIAETILYTKFLKGHNSKRKCTYGIVANLVSWGIGFFLLSQQYEFLVLFM